MARRACSLAASALLHLVALIVVASPATPPRAVAVFVVPPVDDSGPSELNPLEPADDDLMRREDGSGHSQDRTGQHASSISRLLSAIAATSTREARRGY